MKVNTVILDDEQAIIAIVAPTVKQVFESRGVEIEITSFVSAKKCWEYLNRNRVDLLLLDINMPEIDGIKFGRKVRSLLGGGSASLDIIFVSSNEDRVFDTFELSAFGFVRKDSYLTDIARVLTRYIDTKMTANAPKVFEVRDSGGVSVFEADDIVYVESFRNNQLVHMHDGGEVTLHSTMTMLEEKLCDTDGFIRVHKSYIVNCKCVKNFGRTEIVLKSGDSVPVGRAYYVDGIEKYMNYIKLCGVQKIKK